MDSYNIEWKHSAARELRKLPREAVLRILQAVEQLATEPYPHGVRKLVGSERTYRIRVGDYRVVYNVIHQLSLFRLLESAIAERSMIGNLTLQHLVGKTSVVVPPMVYEELWGKIGPEAPMIEIALTLSCM